MKLQRAEETQEVKEERIMTERLCLNSYMTENAKNRGVHCRKSLFDCLLCTFVCTEITLESKRNINVKMQRLYFIQHLHLQFLLILLCLCDCL